MKLEFVYPIMKVENQLLADVLKGSKSVKEVSEEEAIREMPEIYGKQEAEAQTNSDGPNSSGSNERAELEAQAAELGMTQEEISAANTNKKLQKAMEKKMKENAAEEV